MSITSRKIDRFSRFVKTCNIFWNLCDFWNTMVSQGSTATSLRYGGIYNAHVVAIFVLSLAVKELKIDQYFTKLSTWVEGLVFFWLTVYVSWVVVRPISNSWLVTVGILKPTHEFYWQNTDNDCIFYCWVFQNYVPPTCIGWGVKLYSLAHSSELFYHNYFHAVFHFYILIIVSVRLIFSTF